MGTLSVGQLVLAVLLVSLLVLILEFRMEYSANANAIHRTQCFANDAIRDTKEDTEVKDKLILAYTQVYGYDFDVLTYGRSVPEMQRLYNPLAECEYKCLWSTNRSDYNRSDAVIFHMYNNLEMKDFVLADLPTRYNLQQKWVLMAREPPAFFYPDQLRLLNDRFNISMTYQRDSDVIIPYGKYWKMSEAEVKLSNKKMDYLAFKDRKIAWLVSNCVTSSRREKYVEELQQHIKVDIYGACGEPINNDKDEEFREMLGERYLFYLAFENSDCDHYLTEKFWISLMVGMIPVVRGRRVNYKQLAPPNSYIHADTFIDPKQLAEYLDHVSTNLTLLQSYHQWRRTYEANYKLFTSNRKWMCDLCEQVHTSPRQTLDVHKHFSEDTRCTIITNNGYRNRSGENVEDITRQ